MRKPAKLKFLRGIAFTVAGMLGLFPFAGPAKELPTSR
jgi:hypothetical protein